MRVLVVNRNYFPHGGPEKYLFSLKRLMSDIDFIPFAVDFEGTEDTPYRRHFLPPAGTGPGRRYGDFQLSAIGKARFALSTVYSMETKRRVRQLVREARPDVALLLNVVYFSPSLIKVLVEEGIPIIWRLSDFNLICASYFLFRDGKICEECLNHGRWRAFVNQCGGYQRSRLAATARLLAMALNDAIRIKDVISYFITPSQIMNEKMTAAGYPPNKLKYIPTFVELPVESHPPLANPIRFLFVGRVSPEKGIDSLLDAFALVGPGDTQLHIVGPYDSSYGRACIVKIPAALRKRVFFHGPLLGEALTEMYRAASVVIIPSICYENLPNVLLEAMAHSRPVILSNSIHMEESFWNSTGAISFDAGNSAALAREMERLTEDVSARGNLGTVMRDYAIENYSPSKHLELLRGLFTACVGGLG